jgi:ribonuclease H2 subunit C
VSYFRGRKLYGKSVKIPQGYKGVVLSSTDQKLPKESQPSSEKEEEELDENEQPEDIGILGEQAEFDEVMVWGHEALPDESTDPYVRGVEEWTAFAERVGSDLRS